MSYQKLVIVGNLGRDPEKKYTPDGTAICSFNVATNYQYTGADGKKVKITNWFSISVFGKQAESCSTYLRQGSQVLVEGRLSPDPATGGPRVYPSESKINQYGYGASYEVKGDRVLFLTSKDENDTPPQPSASSDDEDIPF